MPARIIINIYKSFHCYPICHFRANSTLWSLQWRKGFNDVKINGQHSDNRKASIKLRDEINIRENCYSIITLGGFPVCFQDGVSQEGKTSGYVPLHSNDKTRQHATDKETNTKHPQTSHCARLRYFFPQTKERTKQSGSQGNKSLPGCYWWTNAPGNCRWQKGISTIACPHTPPAINNGDSAPIGKGGTRSMVGGVDPKP